MVVSPSLMLVSMGIMKLSGSSPLLRVTMAVPKLITIIIGTTIRFVVHATASRAGNLFDPVN